jgi:hypothetical protein
LKFHDWPVAPTAPLFAADRAIVKSWTAAWWLIVSSPRLPAAKLFFHRRKQDLDVNIPECPMLPPCAVHAAKPGLQTGRRASTCRV